MANVLVAVADGCEEMETVIVVDVLRRGGLDVTLASAMPERKIIASRQVELVADCHLTYCQNKPWTLIVVPGGAKGANILAQDPVMRRILQAQFAAEAWVGAICAAPALVLAEGGYIAGYSATCYPSFMPRMAAQSVHVVNEPVVVSRQLVTSQGPGTSFLFALELLRQLQGDVAAATVAESLCLPA